MNYRHSRSGPGKLVAALAFLFVFSIGTVVCVAVGDESVQLLASAVLRTTDTSDTGELAAADNDTTPDVSVTPEAFGASTPKPSPTPAMSDTGEDTLSTPDLEGQQPQPQPTPQQYEEPPLPEPTPTDQTTPQEALPEENLALQTQFDEWDLAQNESPMFLSAAINELGERPLMLTGKWSLKPHLSIGTFYDGNIFLRNKNDGGDQSDIITRVAPGVSMRLGDTDSQFYMMADYTLGLNYYIEHSNQSTVDNDGRAQFQWNLPRTTIGLNVSVSQDTGQDVDVTDRVQRELYDAGLTAHYTLSEKTSFDVGADYTRSDYNGLISSSQYDGDAYFDYQYSPKTQLGVGGAVGVMQVPGAPSQVFEQLNLRATYHATGKLTLVAELGAELREFGGGEGSAITPIFILESTWAIRAGTSLSLTARRSIYASAILDDQNYTATSFDFSIRQRVTDYVDVSLAAGYVNTEYSATTTGVSATREDNYFYVRPEVEWKAQSWLSIGIFYEFSQDLSSGSTGNNFTRDRGGVDIAILF